MPIDPYFWMRDRSNPGVIEYLKRENEYTERMMRHTRELREKLFQELKRRFPEDDCSVPYRKGAFKYYRRIDAGRQYEVYCRMPLDYDGPEEVLLDLNEEARGYDYCDVGAFETSPDGSRLAYTLDMHGAERYDLYVRDVETGDLLSEVIGDVHTRVQWASDNQTLFYTRLDETVRPFRLFRHVIGTDPKNDALMYEEENPAFRLTLTKSRDGRYVFLRSQSQVTTEVRVLAAYTPGGDFKLVEPRQEGVEYYLLHRGDRFYVLTNYEAINFKVAETPDDAPGRANWQDVVPHRDDVMIEDVEMFANHMVLYERRAGLNAVRVKDLRSGDTHDVDFDEENFVCWSGKNPQFDTNVIKLVYSSLVTPETVLAYDMDTRQRVVLKVDRVRGGYDRSAYCSKRLQATAEDGTLVPISLVHRRGLTLDGSNPLLLYGYGAYGASVEPDFWSGRLSLLDRGFVFAIAHVRGGSELGREWYEDGKLLTKMNTFTDFIACAEELFAEGYTSPDNLVIEGTSAGGLLIGTVVNIRPDLCRAAIADVPFVDVVNTMMDESIPRTVTEYDEWGNPVEDKEVKEYLASYSPYDNVARRPYPNILVTAGLDDPRVHYWEPAKWVARLRDLKTDDNLLLLRTDFRSGHFGPSGRFDYLREFAFELAFIFDVLGLTPEFDLPTR